MNGMILEAARGLAELIAQSPEHQLVLQREQEALDDQALQSEYRAYVLLRQELQELLAQDAPEQEQVVSLSQDIERSQGLLQQMDGMLALSEARERFSGLMEGVNRQIQLVLNPDSMEEASGCGPGGCEGCQGCSVR